MTEEVTRFEIAKLELRAGDKLVVRSEMHLSREQMAHIHDSVKCHLPDDVEVIVLGSGLTVEVLRKADQ